MEFNLKSSQIKKISQELVLSSRSVILNSFRSNLKIEEKSDLSPVTMVDKEVEKGLRQIINSRFPDHGIFGEEFAPTNINSRFQWIIDPIDGTRAFITGKPTFGTLIALFEEKKPVFGIIDMPVLDELWIGIKNYGTFLMKNE